MPRLGLRLVGFFSPLLFLLLSVGLLTLAFAPVNQWYLAWIGLVPYLIFISRARSQVSVFAWNWIGGTIFFTANMWWMAFISVPGMWALMIYCGIYWAFAALLIRGAGLLQRSPMTAVFSIAAIWVCFEWIRSVLFTGLPWLFLGHSQSPFLLVCQVADITGVYGISFCIVSVNVFIALLVLRRKKLVPAAICVGIMLVGVCGYGLFRLEQTPGVTTPGPTIAVIQANFPQDNSGSKGAPVSEILSDHLRLSVKALAENPNIDLIVWSETMVPFINDQSIAQDIQIGDIPVATIRREISELASTNHIALLVGAEFGGDWTQATRDGMQVAIPIDRRNSTFFFDRNGQMDDSLGHRYDKVHLVPWGEYIPFKDSFPFLYHLSMQLGPNYYSDYMLHPGSMDQLTVFHLRDGHDWRFVTPICFEDIDARICSAMFRPGDDGQKRADMLINVTNDGWFKANQNAQQLQAAVFRCIENRVPAARSVNTGISGFIDSTGRTFNLLPVRREGESIGRLSIDSRLTFYTVFGDVFAMVCIAATGCIAIAAGWKRISRTGKAKK
ncbi:MAG: apolipoprotein N-acyltransferase [Tepidisphaeraceae bacterium]